MREPIRSIGGGVFIRNASPLHLTYSGSTTVLRTRNIPQAKTVYNLEVKDLHNFLVGNGVVVHNGCIDDLFEVLVSKLLFKGSKIPKMLTISSGGKKVFIPPSGLKHIHEKIFKKGFDAYLDKFTYKIPIKKAENLFSIKMMDMSANVDKVLADVIQNNKWGVKVFSNRWEFIFRAPSPGKEIKLFHAVFK